MGKKIYSYYCRDGVVRTRCRKHFGKGDLGPVNRAAVFREVEASPFEGCVVCFYEEVDLMALGRKGVAEDV